MFETDPGLSTLAWPTNVDSGTMQYVISVQSDSSVPKNSSETAFISLSFGPECAAAQKSSAGVANARIQGSATTVRNLAFQDFSLHGFYPVN